MGLVLDTNILIHAERRAGLKGATLDFSPWAAYGNVSISAMTASELLLGVHRGEGDAHRIRRAAFVEAVLADLPILDFTMEVARIHAEIKADLYSRGEPLGASDMVIAATALASGHAVITTDVDDLGRVPGLDALPFSKDT